MINEQQSRESWNTFNKAHMCIIGIPEGPEKQVWYKTNFLINVETVRAQEDLEELLHVQGQDGRW